MLNLFFLDKQISVVKVAQMEPLGDSDHISCHVELSIPSGLITFNPINFHQQCDFNYNFVNWSDFSDRLGKHLSNEYIPADKFNDVDYIEHFISSSIIKVKDTLISETHFKPSFKASGYGHF